MYTVPIIDADANREFERLISLKFPNTHAWENRYVDHEIGHIGLVLTPDFCPVAGKYVLEFGCNIGATAIVLAHHGARVVAGDIDPSILQLASLNARRYGLAQKIRFELLNSGGPLPFPDRSFDVITCNSVLEYVKPELLAGTQHELGRVLKAGGQLLVFGTSNRLWPVEAHDRRWLINYMPRLFDPWFQRPIQRGVWPWQLRRGFGNGFADLFSGRRVREYVELKRRMGMQSRAHAILTVLSKISATTPISPGLLSPFVTVLLRKSAQRES